MKRKDVLLILVPSFIFVLLWMSFSIYHSFINSTISEVLNIQILPINPSFDTQTISALKNRTHVDAIYEINPSTVASESLDTSQTQTSSSSAKTAAPLIDESANSNSTAGGTLSQ